MSLDGCCLKSLRCADVNRLIVIGQRDRTVTAGEILAVFVGIFLNDADLDRRSASAVTEDYRLCADMLRIKFRDLLHIVRRRILGSSVAPYRRKYDAVKIKYFALLVARL